MARSGDTGGKKNHRPASPSSGKKKSLRQVTSTSGKLREGEKRASVHPPESRKKKKTFEKKISGEGIGAREKGACLPDVRERGGEQDGEDESARLMVPVHRS